MKTIIERTLRDGCTLECGITDDGWIVALRGGEQIARGLEIRPAPKHNMGAEYTYILGTVLLTADDAGKLLAALPVEAPDLADERSTLAAAYDTACRGVRKSFESENTLAQGPAFAAREKARAALDAWNAAHPDWLAERQAERDARHAQSFVARGLD